MAVINVISNLGPLASVGLERDYLILYSALTAAGHRVRPIDEYSALTPQYQAQADINIWLESLHDPRYLHGYAKTNFLFPNPEWWYPEWNQYLPSISLVCAKTIHAHQLWSAKVGSTRCIYTGFESRDLHQPGIGRTPGFLHVAGKSASKGSDTVLEAWRRFQIESPLTIITCARTREESEVGDRVRQLCAGIPHVRHMHNVSDEILTIEFNRNRFYLGPSLYEGFGHTIHEAMGCAAVVLTTGAEPMSDWGSVTIPVVRRSRRMEVEWCRVDAEGVWDVVRRVVRMPEKKLDQLGMESRYRFAVGQEKFRNTITEAVRDWFTFL